MRPAILFLLVASALHAENPALDPYGDPLPDGAISRIGSLRNSRGEVREFAITPDGSRFVAGNDQSLIVRDTRTLAEIRTIPILGGGQNWRIAISGDGKRVAAILGWPLEKDGSHRQSARVWEVESGRCLCEMEAKDTEAGRHGMAISSDGKKLAALGGMIDVDAKKFEFEIPFSRGKNRLEFIAGDKYLIDNASKAWCCWEVATGKGINGDTDLSEAFEFERHFARDGKSIYFLRSQKDEQGKVEIQTLVRMEVEFPTPERATMKLRSPKMFPIGDLVRIERVAAKGSRCLLQKLIENRVASLQLFDAEAGKVIEQLEVESGMIDHVHSAAFAEKSAILVVRPKPSEYLPSVDFATYELPGRKNLTAGRGLVFLEGNLTWMPDGKQLRSGSQLWNTRTGKFLGNAKVDTLPPTRWRPTPTPEVSFWNVVYSETGLAIGLPIKITKRRCDLDFEHLEPEVWDIQKKQKLHKLFGVERGQITTLNDRGLSRDGGVYVQADRHTLFVWDTLSGRLIAHENFEQLPFLDDFLHSLMSPTGRQFICTPAGRILLFDVHSGNAALDLKTGLPANWRLADLDWSPNGRLVALLTPENELRIYDLHSGKVILRKPTTQSGVRLVRFSPDGKSVLTQNSLYGLIWPVPTVEPFFKPLKEDEFATAWVQLSSRSAAECREACFRFAASGDAAAKFLNAKLEADPGLPPERFDQQLSRLRSNDFRKRTAAEKEMLETDEATLARMKKLLETETTDADLVARLKRLIDATKGTVPPRSADLLRRLRSIAILEAIGTDSSRKTLERLAKGAEGSPLTREAKATLKRME